MVKLDVNAERHGGDKHGFGRSSSLKRERPHPSRGTAKRRLPDPDNPRREASKSFRFRHHCYHVRVRKHGQLSNMSPRTGIDDLEPKLNQLPRYKAQEESPSALINADQSDILSCLRDGVQSAQTTTPSLKKFSVCYHIPKRYVSISLDRGCIGRLNMPGPFIAELESLETSLVPSA